MSAACSCFNPRPREGATALVGRPGHAQHVSIFNPRPREGATALTNDDFLRRLKWGTRQPSGECRCSQPRLHRQSRTWPGRRCTEPTGNRADTTCSAGRTPRSSAGCRHPREPSKRGSATRRSARGADAGGLQRCMDLTGSKTRRSPPGCPTRLRPRTMCFSCTSPQADDAPGKRRVRTADGNRPQCQGGCHDQPDHEVDASRPPPSSCRGVLPPDLPKGLTRPSKDIDLAIVGDDRANCLSHRDDD